MNTNSSSPGSSGSGRAPLIAVVGAAFVIAVVVAGVSVMTGASTQGALAIAAVVTLGGIGAAMVLRTALRQRDDVRQNHIWLSSTLDQAGMMAFAEDAAGTPVFSSRPSHTGERMSIEGYLGAPDDPNLSDIRNRARGGETVNQIWTSEVDPARRYEVSAWGGPESGLLWTVRDLGRGVAARLFDEVDALRTTLDFGATGLFALAENGRFVFVNETLAEWLETTPARLMSTEGLTFGDAIGAQTDIAALGGHMTAFPLPGHGEELLIKGRWLGRADAASAGVEMNFQTRAAPIFCGVATKSSDGGLDNAVLFDQAPIAITMLDRSGRIVQSNDAFTALVSIDNPRGQALSAFVAEDQKDAVSVHLTAAMARPVGPMEARLSGEKDLVVLMYAASIQMLEDEAGLIVYLIDSTRQKILEQQIAQSQKMQAVGQLAGGIAHDFNNLLTAMIGFCDLLLQRHRAGDQSFADIMQIKQNANRAARLVRQLLAFSRQQVLEPRPLEVTDALADLNNLLQRLLGEQVEMHMEHGRDLGMVKVDQGQFDQVIINLAVNARDAMPKGGVLTIRTERRHLIDPALAQGESASATDYIVISVKDTGTGIESIDLERIFDPFFTTKDVGAGTGLGLSTVYGIINQTGGHITAENVEEGQGAVFTIYLKRLDDQIAVDASRQDDAPARDVTGGGKILLVEDEDPVRLFSARALRSKGYKVVEARNGEAALDILKAESFDLLITDMIMPKVNGATVIKSAREARRDLPVICISGYTDESVLSEIETMNQVLFLPKPFSLKQLAGKVKEALES